MIKNGKQYASTERKLKELQEVFDNCKDEDEADAYRELIDSAWEEINEYREITSGARQSFYLRCLDDLGSALVKARLAKCLTHQALANELAVSEQMVQRDEARDYENAGLARLADTLDALDYELVGHVRPRTSHVFLDRPWTTDSISSNPHVDIGWTSEQETVRAGQ